MNNFKCSNLVQWCFCLKIEHEIMFNRRKKLWCNLKNKLFKTLTKNLQFLAKLFRNVIFLEFFLYNFYSMTKKLESHCHKYAIFSFKKIRTNAILIIKFIDSYLIFLISYVTNYFEQSLISLGVHIV